MSNYSSKQKQKMETKKGYSINIKSETHKKSLIKNMLFWWKYQTYLFAEEFIIDPSTMFELAPSTAIGEDSRTVNCSGSNLTVTPSIFWRTQQIDHQNWKKRIIEGNTNLAKFFESFNGFWKLVWFLFLEYCNDQP